jgi:hypothetical protein
VEKPGQFRAEINRLYIEAHEHEKLPWTQETGSLIPAHATLSLSDASKTEKRARKAMHACMGAARVVHELIRRSNFVDSDAPHRHRQRPTVNQQIQRTLEAESARKEWLTKQGLVEPPRFDSTIDNFDNRALRPSLPVVHIAMAIANAIGRSQQVGRNLTTEQAADLPFDIGGPQISFASFLTCRELARGAVIEAQTFEAMVAKLPVLQPLPGVPRVHLRLE